jgi:hypothetical protein
MNNSHTTEKFDDSALTAALDNSAQLALALELSEPELLALLAERLHAKESETHAAQTVKKTYDPVAGP